MYHAFHKLFMSHTTLIVLFLYMSGSIEESYWWHFYSTQL